MGSGDEEGEGVMRGWDMEGVGVKGETGEDVKRGEERWRTLWVVGRGRKHGLAGRKGNGKGREGR